mmetsp:Transcript_4866/g.8415  ORF Transcript_4866/g.8415 Transcript_4866/m.8415 type:complete len:158 (+) Transcript_4866:179-652(+)
MGDIDARPDSCAFKTMSATMSSFGAGAIFGAVSATWNDVPKVMKNRAFPALMSTSRVMGSYGITFAAVGAAFASTECIAEGMRGKKDFVNAALGGAAAGGVVGARIGRLGVALAAAASLAATSALVDTTGGFRGSGLFDDGQTPPLTYYPYSKTNDS